MTLRDKFEKSQLILLYIFPVAIIFSTTIANTILIIFSLIFVSRKLKHINKAPSWLLYFFLIILFFLVHPSNFSNFDKIIFFKIIGFLRFPLFFYFAYFLFEKNEHKKHLFYLLIFVTFLITLLSLDIIFQFFNKTDIFGYLPGQWDEELGDYKRYSGFFDDELIGGSYLYLNFLVLILLIKKFYKVRKFAIIINTLVIIVATAILLSGERVALFKFMLLFISSFFILSQNKKLFIFIIFTMLTIITLIAINQPTLKKRLIYSTISEIGSLENIKKNIYHFQHYKTGLSILRDNFLTGTGFKSFRKSCKKYDNDLPELEDRKAISGCSTHPHNFLVEILSDGGVIGLILFLIFLINLIKYLYLKKNYLLIFYLIIYFLPIIPSGSFSSSWINFNFWFILTLGILTHNQLILKKL